jgi:hypothetical protein
MVLSIDNIGSKKSNSPNSFSVPGFLTGEDLKDGGMNRANKSNTPNILNINWIKKIYSLPIKKSNYRTNLKNLQDKNSDMCHIKKGRTSALFCLLS